MLNYSYWKFSKKKFIFVSIFMALTVIVPFQLFLCSYKFYCVDNNHFKEDMLPEAFEINQSHAGLLFSIHINEHLVTYKRNSNSLELLDLEFHCDSKDILKISANYSTGFRCDDECVYFACFNSGSSGGIIAAYSLRDGKKMWSNKLKALGPVLHKLYSNISTIELFQNYIVISGCESYGDYIEIYDRSSGRLIAHKIYRLGYLDSQDRQSLLVPELKF